LFFNSNVLTFKKFKIFYLINIYPIKIYDVKIIL